MIHQDFNGRLNEYEEKRRQKVQMLKDERELKENEECTFAPNQRSKSQSKSK
jgi:hypothetical protein